MDSSKEKGYREWPILVADANFTHFSELKCHFEGLSLRNISVTGRGFRAVELGHRQEFQVIFVSSDLVALDGLQVVTSLRKGGKNTSTPIVYLAELEGDVHLEKAMSLGADAVIRKPVRQETLRQVLEDILNTQIVSEAEERKRVGDSMVEAKKAVEFVKKLRPEGDFEIVQDAFRLGLVELFCGLAENYLSKGDRDSADEIMREAEKIDSEARAHFEIRVEFFVDRGKGYLKKRQYLRARAEFQAALTMNEHNLSAIFGLGEALYGLNEMDEAREAFEKVIKSRTTPDDPQIYTRMGITACRGQHYDLAHQLFDHALRMYPADSKIYYFKAIAFVAAGDFESSVPLLNRALRMEPSFVAARVLDHKVKNWRKQGQKPAGKSVSDLKIH